jgi:two-component system chemotaxis response regulator CheV
MDCNCVTGTVTLDGHFALLLDLERLIVDLDPDLGADAEVDAGPDADRDAGGPLRALVSEDSTTMRSLVRQKLQEARFATEAFQNGQEAWNRLKDMRDDVAARGRPITDLLDVVISDIEMPAMDGYTLTRHIKEDPVLKVLPVILFSSLITDELRHKGESVGADDQISKPEFGTLAQRAMALIRAARATA